MKSVTSESGTFFVDDHVADALEHLARALADAEISAAIRLHLSADMSADLILGIGGANRQPYMLKARPASGDSSHLNIDDY